MPRAASGRTIAARTELKEDAMNKVLIATDGSDSGHQAVEFGLDLAAEQNARAFIVHVTPVVDVMPYANFGYIAPTLPHEFDEHDRELLQEALELAAEKCVAAETTLLKGRPADEIVAFADSIGADLIVVGSRGHGAIASAVIGSVSRDVLHESRRPVLIVRGPRTAQKVGVAA
jgi:nucleotide-binding universal stress UspA family protein